MSVYDCACRISGKYLSSGRKEPLVILSAEGGSRDVASALATKLHGIATQLARSWTISDKRVIHHRNFNDDPLTNKGFMVAVCSAGRTFSEEEAEGVQRWKKASKKRGSGLFW